MRRRLTVLVLAVTSLVVVAFLVPLGAMVQRQADASARSEGERRAQSVAESVVRLTVDEGVAAFEATSPSLPAGAGLVFPDGTVAGEVSDDGLSLASEATSQRRALSAYTADGWELALPVLIRDGVVVVTASVPATGLREGVTRSWLLLAALGVVVIGVSLLLAERLGRSLTDSVGELGMAARALAAGDLATRVEVDDPPELAAVASAFNEMAPRLAALIEQEREEVADLSHRLRTPMARLRLQVETVTDVGVRGALEQQLDQLERAVDEVIAEARRHSAPTRVTDIGALVTERGLFWSVLAEEQHRPFDVTVRVDPRTPVEVGARELTAALDAILGNVFDHTSEGVGFVLGCEPADRDVVISVEDAGPGFPGDIDPLARGVSGGGSTGLGLDIARRAAERAGGLLRVGPGRLGGGRVELILPISRGS